MEDTNQRQSDADFETLVMQKETSVQNEPERSTSKNPHPYIQSFYMMVTLAVVFILIAFVVKWYMQAEFERVSEFTNGNPSTATFEE